MHEIDADIDSNQESSNVFSTENSYADSLISLKLKIMLKYICKYGNNVIISKNVWIRQRTYKLTSNASFKVFDVSN